MQLSTPRTPTSASAASHLLARLFTRSSGSSGSVRGAVDRTGITCASQALSQCHGTFCNLEKTCQRTQTMTFGIGDLSCNRPPKLTFLGSSTLLSLSLELRREDLATVVPLALPLSSALAAIRAVMCGAAGLDGAIAGRAVVRLGAAAVQALLDPALPVAVDNARILVMTARTDLSRIPRLALIADLGLAVFAALANDGKPPIFLAALRVILSSYCGLLCVRAVRLILGWGSQDVGLGKSCSSADWRLPSVQAFDTTVL